jgi:hypothetical protein
MPLGMAAKPACPAYAGRFFSAGGRSATGMSRAKPDNPSAMSPAPRPRCGAPRLRVTGGDPPRPAAILAGRQLSSRAASASARVPCGRSRPGPPWPLTCQARRLRPRCARHPTARSQRRAVWPDRSRLGPMATTTTPSCQGRPLAAAWAPRDAAARTSRGARRPGRGVGCLAQRASGRGRCRLRQFGGRGGRGPQATGGSRRPRCQPASCAPAGIARGRSAARGDGRGVEVPRSAFRTQGTLSARVAARAARRRRPELATALGVLDAVWVRSPDLAPLHAVSRAIRRSS